MYICPVHSFEHKKMHEKRLVTGGLRIFHKPLNAFEESFKEQRLGAGLILPTQLTMSQKKRKHASHEETERPSKKTAVRQGPSEVVKVSMLPEEDEWAPIVGMLVCVCIFYKEFALLSTATRSC